ncbi:protein Wnt-10b [Calliphora vicina]|uniref:protein Wnt-10b n=1 Tax=Calliphora vicina TaxID=7373 RepID=UPI00325BB342
MFVLPGLTQLQLQLQQIQNKQRQQQSYKFPTQRQLQQQQLQLQQQQQKQCQEQSQINKSSTLPQHTQKLPTTAATSNFSSVATSPTNSSKRHRNTTTATTTTIHLHTKTPATSTGNLTVTPRCLHLHLHLIIVIILACCTTWLHCLPDGRATCRSVPGLTKDQLELCYKASDVTTAALEGLDLAIRECQIQFQWHRWNCSSLNTKSRNPHASNLLKKGYRESAFAFAISAAGVAHSVARACSQGRLMSCGCDPSVNRKTLNKNLRQSLDKEKKQFLQYLETNQILTAEDEKKYERSKIASRWKWGGCSHNMDFGVEFSKLFLDCREKAGDIQSKINLHNNHAGRIAVSNNMEFRCKCHGMSGSCQLKTCWKSAPDFHVVGKVLKHQFRRALLVDQSNLGNGEPIVVLKRSRNKKSNNGITNTERTNERHERPSNTKVNTEKNAQRSARKLETSLFYYQRSPNFCEKDPSADILGTVGRKCNRNSTLSDGCTSLCCGRGYSLVKERRAERCHCKFQWCCNVECDECHVEEWISVCN